MSKNREQRDIMIN